MTESSPLQGGVEGSVRTRIARFIAGHPEWHLRLYRTPAGMRVLAMHRTFDPEEPAVADCFHALGVDPIYARMCLNQHCFRARAAPSPGASAFPATCGRARASGR
jgi:hypothetical protein